MATKEDFDCVSAEKDITLSESFLFDDTITTAVNTILKYRLPDQQFDVVGDLARYLPLEVWARRRTSTASM